MFSQFAGGEGGRERLVATVHCLCIPCLTFPKIGLKAEIMICFIGSSFFVRRRCCVPPAFTLVEVMIAVAIATLSLVTVMNLNSAHLRLVRSSRETNAVSLCLQERGEQLRSATWRQVIDPDFISDQLLVKPPKNAAPLAGYKETITVQAYPDPKAADRIVIEKEEGGTAVHVESGDGLSEVRVACIEIGIAWRSDGRTRVRSSTLLISSSGISRLNLPASFAGANPIPQSPYMDTVPAATPAPDSTPPPANNGNGNSKGGQRGTINGEQGKK
ncbi:MAG: hypothetical protein M3463_08010 [Verrucomicrobiota bacterium]|nr:hypothetical protein [Verrucomicrobiota bacterium]